MHYYIYKYLDQNNNIVYIGQTVNLEKRIDDHKRDKLKDFSIIYYFECQNKTEMCSYEYFLIKKYSPPLNVVFNTNIHTDMSLTEPDWILYTNNISSLKNKQDNKQVILNKKNKLKIYQPSDLIKTIDFENNPPQFVDYSIFSILEQKIIVYTYLNQNQFNFDHFRKTVYINSCNNGTLRKTIKNAVDNLLVNNIFIEKENALFLNENHSIAWLNLPIEILMLVFNNPTKYFLPMFGKYYYENEKILNFNIEEMKLNLPIDNKYHTLKKCIFIPIENNLEVFGFSFNTKILKNGHKYTNHIIQLI